MTEALRSAFAIQGRTVGRLQRLTDKNNPVLFGRRDQATVDGILMTEKPLEQMGLRDLRGIMRQKTPAEAWKHFNGAAETKATFHRNPRAFHQYLFRQKIFHDVSEPDISVEL